VSVRSTEDTTRSVFREQRRACECKASRCLLAPLSITAPSFCADSHNPAQTARANATTVPNRSVLLRTVRCGRITSQLCIRKCGSRSSRRWQNRQLHNRIRFQMRELKSLQPAASAAAAQHLSQQVIIRKLSSSCCCSQLTSADTSRSITNLQRPEVLGDLVH
jgi:hypothetical protein